MLILDINSKIDDPYMTEINGENKVLNFEQRNPLSKKFL